eukprot:SAG31_NODE_6455_length_2012_cov_1.463147_1_plen_78_part_00
MVPLARAGGLPQLLRQGSSSGHHTRQGGRSTIYQGVGLASLAAPTLLNQPAATAVDDLRRAGARSRSFRLLTGTVLY